MRGRGTLTLQIEERGLGWASGALGLSRSLLDRLVCPFLLPLPTQAHHIRVVPVVDAAERTVNPSEQTVNRSSPQRLPPPARAFPVWIEYHIRSGWIGRWTTLFGHWLVA